MKKGFATGMGVIGAIIGILLGVLIFSGLVNFVPATIIYFLLLALGIHQTYWHVYIGTYLIVFIANLILKGNNAEKN